MTIKELFDKAEGGVLSFEQFEAAAKAGNAKFTDLSEGNYVSKVKYTSDLEAKDDQIKTLNDTISTRDTDLTDLKTKLEAAGADTDKLATLTNDFTALQSKYTEDTNKYEAKLSQQAYEFAVREFANSKKFTSEAAKRDFTRQMIAENLKLKDDKIVGADDFVASYAEGNKEAFVVEKPDEGTNPTPAPQQLPHFVGSTPGGNPTPAESNAFAEAFHFTGVRPIPQK